jgi:hypothetical protein
MMFYSTGTNRVLGAVARSFNLVRVHTCEILPMSTGMRLWMMLGAAVATLAAADAKLNVLMLAVDDLRTYVNLLSFNPRSVL